MYYKYSTVQILLLLLLLLGFFFGGGGEDVYFIVGVQVQVPAGFHFEFCLKTKGKTAVHGCRCSGDVAVCVCVR